MNKAVEIDRYAGLYVAVGIAGSGKSHSVHAQAYDAARAGVPVIAQCVTREWTEVPPDLAPHAAGAQSVADAILWIKSGKRFVITQSRNWISDAHALMRWAISSREPKGLAIPEAHMCVAKSSAALPDEVMVSITQHRHYGLSMWLDSQRPALLNTTALSMAREVRVFALAGPPDLDWAHETGGKELVALVREAAKRHADAAREEESYPRGSPEALAARAKRGWHVRLDQSRLGPYELVRL